MKLELDVSWLVTCMRVTTTHIGFVNSTFTHLQIINFVKILSSISQEFRKQRDKKKKKMKKLINKRWKIKLLIVA